MATYSTLANFNNKNSTTGFNPASPLRQNTNGLFDGTAYYGGEYSTCNCGVIYRFDMGLAAFANLQTTSGKEDTRIGILGQGFTSSSIVKFGNAGHDRNPLGVDLSDSDGSRCSIDRNRDRYDRCNPADHSSKV